MDSVVKPKRRPGAVLLGFVLGVVTTLVFSLATSFLLSTPKREIGGSWAGADISRHGGVKLVVANEGGEIAVTCNGVCDDVRFEQDSADDVYKLSVFDAAGKCLLCDGGDYVTNGFQDRWTVGGQDKLEIHKTSKSNY